MFELRTTSGEQTNELVAQARAAKQARSFGFQVFVPHGDRWDEESDTAYLLDLLEPEGWMLENVANAAEGENQRAYGVRTVTVVGTIYTFRLA